MVNREEVMSEIGDVLSGNPVLLSVTQTAEILNISRTSVYRLLETGDLDAIRINLTGDRKPTVRITSDSVHKLFKVWMGGTS
jgi:excisionase family DNA binding protein